MCLQRHRRIIILAMDTQGAFSLDKRIPEVTLSVSRVAASAQRRKNGEKHVRGIARQQGGEKPAGSLSIIITNIFIIWN